MGRVFTTLIGTICVATVVTQAIAGGVLWWHGRLTPSAWSEIAAALDGASDEEESDATAEDETPPADGSTRTPLYEEVLDRRAKAILDLADRTEQLRSAARTVSAEAERVVDDRAALAAERAAFARELTAARETLTAESTELTRGLLKNMGARKSVEYLTDLPDLSVVTLIKGLDERTASKVLAEFAGGTEQEKAKGAAVFAALHAGQPEAAAFDAAAGDPASTASPPGSPGG